MKTSILPPVTRSQRGRRTRHDPSKAWKIQAEELKSLLQLEGCFEDEDEKRSNPDSIYDDNGMATIYF
jgi:hypothetical protein